MTMNSMTLAPPGMLCSNDEVNANAHARFNQRMLWFPPCSSMHNAPNNPPSARLKTFYAKHTEECEAKFVSNSPSPLMIHIHDVV